MADFHEKLRLFDNHLFDFMAMGADIDAYRERKELPTLVRILQKIRRNIKYLSLLERELHAVKLDSYNYNTHNTYFLSEDADREIYYKTKVKDFRCRVTDSDVVVIIKGLQDVMNIILPRLEEFGFSATTVCGTYMGIKKENALLHSNHARHRAVDIILSGTPKLPCDPYDLFWRVTDGIKQPLKIITYNRFVHIQLAQTQTYITTHYNKNSPHTNCLRVPYSQ